MIVRIEPAKVSHAARARGRTRSGFRHSFSKNCPQDLKWCRKSRLAILYNLREKSGAKIEN
jgi:hypothetical protein